MIPNHVGIILDGNRRFAKLIGENPWIGHKHGIEKVREMVDWASDKGINTITVYVLSIENMETRPKKELEMILKYFNEELDEVLSGNHVIHRRKCKVKFIGSRNVLPMEIVEKMISVEKMTQENSNHNFNVCVAYGGRQEISDTCKKIAEMAKSGEIEIDDITEDLIEKNLWIRDSPDLIIRTGGERRLSNFLPFQSTYSEIFFENKKWPEVTIQDFENALSSYNEDSRRFGG